VDRYNAEYPLGEMYEAFCLYELDKLPQLQERVVLQGSTKLPPDMEEAEFAQVYDYWGDCLQELILLLPGASWHIHVDHMDVTRYFDYPE